jgi:hypothetical protein
MQNALIKSKPIGLTNVAKPTIADVHTQPNKCSKWLPLKEY